MENEKGYVSKYYRPPKRTGDVTTNTLNMDNNYLFTFDGGGTYYLRTRENDRPRPVADRIMHRLESFHLVFTLFATAIAFLFTNYLLGYPGLVVFIWTGGTFSVVAFGGLWIVLPLIRRMMGYRKVHEWEVKMDRRNAYVRTLSGHDATEFLQEEYFTMLQGGTPISDMENRRRNILRRLNASEQATFLRNEALATEEGAGANRKKMRDFNNGVAVGYVAGRSRSRYF